MKLQTEVSAWQTNVRDLLEDTKSLSHSASEEETAEHSCSRSHLLPPGTDMRRTLRASLATLPVACTLEKDSLGYRKARARSS